MTTTFHRSVRGGAGAVLLMIAASCSNLGSLGNVLGSVLGGGGNEVAGTVRTVDTQNQQIALQQSNGETVALQFDNQTKVVYQNRNYSVTSLETGDQVSARVQQLQNGGYYTDSVVVTQPVSGSNTGTSSQNVQSLQGVVRQVDRNNGLFTMDAGNGALITVSLPYNASSTDVNRFNNLRANDSVRFYGVYLNNTRVELRQFY
jgi:Cu/Ag efflux protein CusF